MDGSVGALQTPGANQAVDNRTGVNFEGFYFLVSGLNILY